MKVLSIETSCDETSIAILDATGGISNASFKVFAHETSSQINIHIPYGGVFPALAKREHIKNLPLLLGEVLVKAKLIRRSRKSQKSDFRENPGIDAVAVTSGPGLEIALWTGITFAQKLAKEWGVPLIPVNHMEGHFLSAFGKHKGSFRIPKVKTPLLALLVSGGHTQLVLSKKWLRYEIIGETQDDAVGEAFDKVARMLNLPYPGGPQISKLAEEKRNLPRVRRVGKRTSHTSDVWEETGITLPRPMLKSKDFNFSYSGLKTAVLYLIKKIGTLDQETTGRIALEFENAAIECLAYKTCRAIEKYRIKTLVVAGGVSANEHLRREITGLRQSLGRVGKDLKIYFPPRELTGDNALMIGIAGYLELIRKRKKVPPPESVEANGNLSL